METFLGIDYPTLWFAVIAILFTGYAVLDGFDFGAGVWHLGLKSEEEKRVSLNAIGPIWDGNEVWLVIGGGALFAGFPLMYASFLSALYIPFILFLLMIIFRAVSIEFRGKEPMMWWKKIWDTSYGISSLLLGFLLGVVLGNILQGVALGYNFEYGGGPLFEFLTPYALLIGAVTLALFMFHGALFMLTKTSGDLQKGFKKKAWISFVIFIILFAAANVFTHSGFEYLSDTMRATPILFAIPGIAIACIILSVLDMKKENYTRAFLFSAAFIVCMLTTVSIELFPILLHSTVDPEYTITVYNAASSDKTIGIMLTMTAIGFPLLIGYTIFAYKVFSGKVSLDEHSY